MHAGRGFPPYKMHVSATALAHPGWNGGLRQGVHNPAAVSRGFTPVSALTAPCSPADTKPESLYTPNDAKAGPGTRRPCETPHRCGPLRGVFSGPFLVHTIWRRRRRRRWPRPRREGNDLTRTLKTRPDPKAPRQSPVPASTATGKNATFEQGTCHSSALGPVAKMPLPATDHATPVWKMPASPGVHSHGPVEGDCPPFQLRNIYEIADRQKCRWRQIPVHPIGIAQGASNTGACRPPHMIPPTGGYAGGLACSHSLVASPMMPTTQTDTR